MIFPKACQSQYLAALEMLKQAVLQCPESLWNKSEHENRFWHIAYHALFYTHLYLQKSEKDFSPWSKHREDYNFLGLLPWPPHKKPEIGEPYSKDEILEYHQFVQQQVLEKLPSLDFNDQSGFSWLPFNKMELMMYNLRHLQQHIGELYERLGASAGVEIDWVGAIAGK